jgi:prepilin-type N-terminal cleavage/methylation domain-containing protein
MLSRNRQKGFTLIELLIVVAIIGIIAALLIPNFLDALQKAKQKRTVADIRNTGTAMFSWLTDQVGAAAAGADATSTVEMDPYNDAKKEPDELRELLVPRYMQEIPAVDGWKNEYEFYLNDTAPLDPQVMLIRSGGRDGDLTATEYEVSSFDPTDYDQDIVWADGFFVRWPQNMKAAAGG